MHAADHFSFHKKQVMFQTIKNVFGDVSLQEVVEQGVLELKKSITVVTEYKALVDKIINFNKFVFR
jgi:hypothetical protein